MAHTMMKLTHESLLLHVYAHAVYAHTVRFVIYKGMVHTAGQRNGTYKEQILYTTR